LAGLNVLAHIFMLIIYNGWYFYSEGCSCCDQDSRVLLLCKKNNQRPKVQYLFSEVDTTISRTLVRKGMTGALRGKRVFEHCSHRRLANTYLQGAICEKMR